MFVDFDGNTEEMAINGALIDGKEHKGFPEGVV